jgi:NAD+ diphosphatase
MPDYRPLQANPLSHSNLDRASHRRADSQWVEAVRCAEQSFVAPVWRAKSLIESDGKASRAALIPSRLFDWESASDVTFLGLSGDTVYFAADISSIPEDAVAATFGDLGSFQELRIAGRALPNDEAALLAYAKGILWWNERHRFCGVCGSPTRSTDAGHRRICTNEDCKVEQFPRSDPAIIVLVECEDRCLLARGARFPEGFHSVLAGFVEPGESLEDAVAREVFEECGVRVTDIVYNSSQPWPFPSSLMLGFRARALSPDLCIDMNEIVAADWYTRDWIRALDPEGPFKIPPSFSISGRLIRDWLAEG